MIITIEDKVWWHRPLVPALRRQKQMDCFEFEGSLHSEFQSGQGYMVRPCLKETEPNQTKTTVAIICAEANN